MITKSDIESAHNALHRDTPEGQHRQPLFLRREQAAAACLRAKRVRRVDRLITTMEWLGGAMMVALNVVVWTPSEWAALAVCLLGVVTAAIGIVTVFLGCRLDGRDEW